MIPRAFILAIKFMTRLPAPDVDGYGAEDIGLVAPFVPLVGVIIGVALACAAFVLGSAGPWVGALGAVAAWVLITGGLHLDGLGDVADAFGAAHRDPNRFAEVLRDPHAGSFAVIAIGLALVAKLVLVAALAPSSQGWVLLLVPAWARWGTLVWSLTVPPLQSGLGAGFAQNMDRRVVAAWGVVLTGASVLLAPALLVALLVVPAGTLYWRRSLGGITGDCLGASVEVTEIALLLAAVMIAAWLG